LEGLGWIGVSLLILLIGRVGVDWSVRVGWIGGDFVDCEGRVCVE